MDTTTEIIMSRVAEEAAERAVQKALLSMGVDHANPLESQRDMVALREVRALLTDEEFKRDLAHLRQWRKAMEGVQSKGLLTAIGILVTGLCAALWVGFQSFVGR